MCGVLGFSSDVMADGGWCSVDHAGTPLRNHDGAVADQHKSSFVAKLAWVRAQPLWFIQERGLIEGLQTQIWNVISFTRRSVRFLLSVKLTRRWSLNNSATRKLFCSYSCCLADSGNVSDVTLKTVCHSNQPNNVCVCVSVRLDVLWRFTTHLCPNAYPFDMLSAASVKGEPLWSPKL